MDNVPATFVLAGIYVENCGSFTGNRGEQLARRFTTLKASPSNYSTILSARTGRISSRVRTRAAPSRPQARQPAPAGGLFLRATGGYIVSLSHLIREAAIMAILSGTKRVDETLLGTVEFDHAATQEAETRHQAARKNGKGGKK
jgi:hypothetical protein